MMFSKAKSPKAFTLGLKVYRFHSLPVAFPVTLSGEHRLNMYICIPAILRTIGQLLFTPALPLGFEPKPSRTKISRPTN